MAIQCLAIAHTSPIDVLSKVFFELTINLT